MNTTFNEGVRLSQQPVQPQDCRQHSEAGHGVPQVPGHSQLETPGVFERPFELSQQSLMALSVGAM